MTTSTNNSIRSPKYYYVRERYGAEGYIYYKHTIKQRIMYKIQHPTYGDLKDI